MHYYNENDPHAAQWLRNLIADQRLPHGDVDDRSIVDVQAADLTGYTQCHFFAGIGGWPLALRLAGWPDDRPVWTGSCPCQPFSVVGRQKGTSDSRDLWPVLLNLISECRPDTFFAEQVSGKGGVQWFDRTASDLETLDYAVGALDVPAAAIGAPHLRYRIWVVAHTIGVRGSGSFPPRSVGSLRPWGSCSTMDMQSILDSPFASGHSHAQPLLRSVDDGIPPGVAHQLRGYGNAIVPQVAAEFIAAYTEAITD